mgnify:CR=1 FL=1
MPLPLIAIIAAWAATVAVVVLLIIYYDDIIKWFKERSDIKEADKENIAFTLKQKIESGDYKVVQGIFNKRTATVEEGRVMQAEKIDEDFAKVHGRKQLVLYE